MTVSVPSGVGPGAARRRRIRRPARHAGGDGGVHHRVAMPPTPPSRPTRPSPSRRPTCAGWVAICWRSSARRAATSSGSTPAGGPAQEPTPTRSVRNDSSAMPFRHDVRSVTVPGCVDGWLALHSRFGRLELAKVLAPAIRLAAGGFPASPLLVGSLHLVDDDARRNLVELTAQAIRPGAPVRRAGVALTLQAIVRGGRDGVLPRRVRRRPHRARRRAVHRRRPGDDPRRLGRAAADRRPSGSSSPRSAPNSQGYLTLGAARLADELGAARRSGRPDLAAPPHRGRRHRRLRPPRRPPRGRRRRRPRRPDRHPRAPLVDRQRAGRAARLGRRRATPPTCAPPTTRGWPSASSSPTRRASARGSSSRRRASTSTTAASGSTCEPATSPSTGRAAGRRTRCARRWPPRDGDLVAVFGTMGGDAQPQILLQLTSRLFGARPGRGDDRGRPAAGRFAGRRRGSTRGRAGKPPTVVVEGHAPAEWRDGLDRPWTRRRASPRRSTPGSGTPT